MSALGKILFVNPFAKKHLASEKRETLRLKYPVGARAAIDVRGIKYQVLNISESGVKFICQLAMMPQEGALVNGFIYFKGQTPFAFSGQVVRTLGYLVTVKFHQALPEDRFGLELSRFYMENKTPPKT